MTLLMDAPFSPIVAQDEEGDADEELAEPEGEEDEEEDKLESADDDGSDEL